MKSIPSTNVHVRRYISCVLNSVESVLNFVRSPSAFVGVAWMCTIERSEFTCNVSCVVITLPLITDSMTVTSHRSSCDDEDIVAIWNSAM